MTGRKKAAWRSGIRESSAGLRGGGDGGGAGWARPWCAREDSNLHPLRDQILSLACLPFHHSRRQSNQRTACAPPVASFQVGPQMPQRNADTGFLNRSKQREQRTEGENLCCLRFLLFKAVCRFCVHLRLSAAIPVPLVCGKGQFESGVAAKVLREFAQDPFPYLDEAGKKKMMAAHSDLLRKFTELAFDESAESRWQESQPAEADNIDVGPATEADLQGALMEASGNPF